MKKSARTRTFCLFFALSAAVLILAVGLTGCGVSTGPAGDVIDDTDSGRDVTQPEDLQGDDSSRDEVDAGPVGVQFDGPRSVPPGSAVPIVVTVGDPEYTDTLGISVDGQPMQVVVARGRGSIPFQVPAVAGTVRVEVTQEGYEGGFDLVVEERPVREMSGTLAGDDLVWNSSSDVVLTADATVPAGSELIVAEGTRVRLADKVRLDVDGTMSVTGTHDAPVWFLPAASVPAESGWGEIDVTGKVVSTFTWFTGAGADASRAFGHSASEPVIRVASAATVQMSGGGVVDSPGKAFASESGTVLLDGLLISRVDQGGEHKASLVEVRRTHFMQIPDGDGVVNDDDNDCIYLNDSNGTGPSCLLQDCVFFQGEDDAIDHNGAEVVIDRAWISDFAHEGVAASKGRNVTIVDSVIMHCDQGIEAGYEGPMVHVQNCLVTGNGVGLRWGDSYEWTATGTMDVRNTVAVGNTRDNVLFWDDQQGDAPAGSVSIKCSMVDDNDFNGVDSNLPGVPSWNESGCIRNGEAGRPEGCGPLGPQTCEEPTFISAVSVSVAEADWKWMHDHPEDLKGFPVTVSVGGKKFEGAEMEVHGGFARTVPKLSFRFEIPDEQSAVLDLFGDGPEKQRRFVLKAAWIDGTWVREYLMMDLLRRAGGLAPRVAFTDFYVNGEWQGLYLLEERIDKPYLKRQRLEDDDMCLLKAENHAANWKSKDNPLDGYDMQYFDEDGVEACSAAMGLILDACTGTATTDAAFAEYVEPLLNLNDYMVFEYVRSFADDRDAFTKNYYLHVPLPDDGEPEDGVAVRARLINWDSDAVFGNNWDGKVIDADNTDWYGWDAFAPRLLSVPAWRAKYLEEFRYSLLTFMRPVILKARAERVASVVRDDAVRDLQKWDRGMEFDDELTRLKQNIGLRYNTMVMVVTHLY